MKLLTKLFFLCLWLLFIGWIMLMVNILMHPNAYKPYLLEALQYELGSDFEFEGTIEAEYGLIPKFGIQNFKMIKHLRGRRESITEAKKITFKLAIWDLLNKKINIKDLQVDEGVINIDLDHESYLENFVRAVELIPKMSFSNTKMNFTSGGRLYPVSIHEARVSKHLLHGREGHALIELSRVSDPRIPFQMNGTLQLSREEIQGNFEGRLMEGDASGSLIFRPNSKESRVSLKLHGWNYPAGATLSRLKISNQVVRGILNFYVDLDRIRNLNERALSEASGSVAVSISQSEFHKDENLKHYSHDNDYVTTMSCILIKGNLGRGELQAQALLFDAEAISAKGFGRANLVHETVDVTVLPDLKNSIWEFLATPVHVTGGVHKLQIDQIRDSKEGAELRRKFDAETPREFSRFLRTELKIGGENRCLNLLKDQK